MQSVDSIPVFSYHALDLSVCQEEAKVARKEQEAQEMAEAARAEIDNVMDSIQLRLREAKEKLKQDIAESEKLPSEQRARQQASLIRAFKDHLHEIMSLDGAGERGTHFFFCQLYCSMRICAVGNSVTFQGESLLQQSRATEPTVHAVFCLFVF